MYRFALFFVFSIIGHATTQRKKNSLEVFTDRKS